MNPGINFSLQYNCISPSKRCRSCNEIKSLCDFSISNHGVYPNCHDCRKAKSRETLKKFRGTGRNKAIQERYKNSDKYKEYKKRKWNDPQYKLRESLRNRTRLALQGQKKSKKTEQLVGITFNDLKKYLESKFKKGMTWDNYGKYWHVDHIIPCAAFDLSKPEEQQKCFHYSNLQPLEAKKNFSKGARILEPIQLTMTV